MKGEAVKVSRDLSRRCFPYSLRALIAPEDGAAYFWWAKQYLDQIVFPFLQ